MVSVLFSSSFSTPSFSTPGRSYSLDFTLAISPILRPVTCSGWFCIWIDHKYGTLTPAPRDAMVSNPHVSNAFERNAGANASTMTEPPRHKHSSYTKGFNSSRSVSVSYRQPRGLRRDAHRREVKRLRIAARIEAEGAQYLRTRWVRKPRTRMHAMIVRWVITISTISLTLFLRTPALGLPHFLVVRKAVLHLPAQRLARYHYQLI